MKAKPFIYAALGARGTGKSAWSTQLVDRLKPPRLAIWDLMQEHGPATGTLSECIVSMKARRFRVVFHPSRDDRRRAIEFEVWCRALLAAGNLVAWVEELAFVTTPYKAPAAWREMVLLGRHDMHRLSILATSQRPAQVDKDFLGNCDLVHVGRLAHAADAKVAANVLGVDFRAVMQMPDLAYVEKGQGGKLTSGTLSFAGKKPAAPASVPKPEAEKVTVAPPLTDSPAPSVADPPEARKFNPLEPWT